MGDTREIIIQSVATDIAAKWGTPAIAPKLAADIADGIREAHRMLLAAESILADGEGENHGKG